MAQLFDSERVDALFAVLGESAGRRLFISFADALPGEVRAIAAVAAQGNFAATERCAHGIKGAAANFGAARLQAVSRKVELAAHGPVAPGALPALLAELECVARSTSVAARRI